MLLPPEEAGTVIRSLQSSEDLLRAAARSGDRLRENIANTRPLELMTFSGGSLFVPRAYAELLDRWEQVEEDLVARARICKGCAAQISRWGGWRTPSPFGYATLSRRAREPPSRYTGHLRGVLYDSPRVRGTLKCWWHSETWTKDVTVPETVVLVRDFVDQALAAAQPDAVVSAARAASGTTAPA